MKKLVIILFINVVLFCLIMQACKKEKANTNTNQNTTSTDQLSHFGIFTGTLSNLTPSAGFQPYYVASALFSDYAEKQRLIKIPAGTKLTASGDGLLQFPDGTVIVKTFYYYFDVANPGLGKKIIETRLLQLNNGQWNVSTYRWKDDQSDAELVKATGDTVAVSWKDATGLTRQINYQIPSIANCKTCHNSTNTVIPIGLKARNLNFNITVNGSSINQLDYLSKQNLLSYSGSITNVPDYNDTSVALELRARAYLDINCAHCHNTTGVAARTSVHFDYDLSFDQTGIAGAKFLISNDMKTKYMPLIGTTVVHSEGLALIDKYLDSL